MMNEVIFSSLTNIQALLHEKSRAQPGFFHAIYKDIKRKLPREETMKYLLLIIAALYVVSVQAEVYKWVDEKGRVHYGDKPGAGSQAIEVKQHEAPDKPAATGEDELSRDEKRQRISNMLEEDRLEKNKEREKKNKERERKKRECNRLKDHQRHTERASRLYKLDKDGNRVFLPNDQREKSQQKLRKRIKKACS